jgi:radical SAM superfamily enzyme YgiQ (UPF0313 family)
MKIQFIYPAFDRHAQSHPELADCVPCNEYIGSPSLGIAAVAACTPPGHEVAYIDDRIHPVDEHLPEAELYALSFFTPAAERALAIADALRAEGRTVVAGGIFPSMMPELCQQHFDAVVVGEGEAVWPRLVADAAADRLQPIYRNDAPLALDSLPRPAIELYLDAEDDGFAPDDYPLQLSRGCPFRCDACVLPGCMGRKIRFFPEDAVWELVGAFAERGKRCCLTEDTSFMPVPGTRRRFRSLLARIAEARGEQPLALSYVGTSMPLLLNIEPAVFDEVRRAGIGRFYLVGGFDPITRGAFGPGDAEATAKAESCVRRCQDHGIEPYVSFLVGNEQDDEGTFDRILEFGERVGLNIAEFAVATPYPGTPMWRKMEAEGRLLHRDWRCYNDANVVFQPARMSPERLQQGYLDLWREFYKPRQHLREADPALCTVQF